MRFARRVYAEIIAQVQGVSVAFLFLSRIPIPISPPFNAESCRRSASFFPLVGFILGLLLYGFAWLASLWFPPAVVAVMLTWLWIALTGALHLDGLIDSADGLFSHRSPARILDIMRDSRIGAMGATAAVLALLMKAALLYAMLEVGAGFFAFYWLLVPAFSRWFMVVAIARWPYAGKQDGVGHLFAGVRRPQITTSFLLIVLLALLLQLTSFRLPFGDWLWGIVILAVSACVGGWLIASYISRKLGGLTGDSYGALNEALELLLLAAAWVVVIHL